MAAFCGEAFPCIGPDTATIPLSMETEKGVLHIVRNFHEIDGSGVYDVAFTAADSSDPKQRVRRFFGEQELTEFLHKQLHRPAEETKRLLTELHQSGHARIFPIELPSQELRKLKLAA